jgi:GxxExxY protein
MSTEPTLEELNPFTEQVIGCAIEVHKQLGGGLLESVYEKAMCIELDSRGLKYECQPTFPVLYKGRRIGDQRADLIVEQSVLVELKSVERFDPVFEAQILTYLRCTRLRIGLLINFHSRLLKTGIRRYVL